MSSSGTRPSPSYSSGTVGDACSQVSTTRAAAADPGRVIGCIRSGLEMLGEERLEALPGVLRRIGPIRVAFVAEEAMRRARVDDDLCGLLEPCQRRLDVLDLFVGNEGVLIAEEEHHRAG